MTLAFVDTHAHIQGEEFAADLQDVLSRSRAAGLRGMVIPGVDVETSRAAVALAEAHEDLYATTGFHPHEASRLDDAGIAAVEDLLARECIVAVGEIGLDYYYEHSPRDSQLACLEKMLALAEARAMPVVIHCRDAWEDAADVLGAWSRRAGKRFEARPLGVMHYFTGTLEQARFYIDCGFLISVHTSVTHKKNDHLREVVAGLRLQSLVIETDSPYGAPQAVRGKRNEPAYVIEAAKAIAEAHDVPLDEVAARTTENAARLFGLAVRQGAPA